MPTETTQQTYTDYIVWSEEVIDYHVEFITVSEQEAWNKLHEEQAEGHHDVHIHKVVGRTPLPLNEDGPISEICLNHACDNS